MDSAKSKLSVGIDKLPHVHVATMRQLMIQARHHFSESNLEDAEKCCLKCLTILENHDGALALMGRIAFKGDDLEKAKEYLKKSLDINSNAPKRRFIYGTILRLLNQNDEALVEINKCLEQDPTNSKLLNARAGLYNIMGRGDEAREIYLRLLADFPQSEKPYYNFALLHKFSDEDVINAVYEELATNIADFKSPSTKKSAHFALGKYYDDLEKYKTAFSHYLLGNNIQKEIRNYSVENEIEGMCNLRKAFPKNGRWISEIGSDGSVLSEAPVFIVGMPRSGTTLVEQILASHPDVTGLGETQLLGSRAVQLAKMNSDSDELFPEKKNLKRKFSSFTANLGDELLDSMLSQAPTSKRIVEKMPQNFLHIGQLSLMLPNARIIHVKRNPIDTCVSNFCTNFEGNLDYSNNLSTLGRYYVAYAQLMKHWKDVLSDKIFEVQYEDVVSNLEANARSLIEFMDLEWNDACLQFYTHKRSVNTASFNQVRQPVYKSSVGRYERYGIELEPLLTALKPVLQ